MPNYTEGDIKMRVFRRFKKYINTLFLSSVVLLDGTTQNKGLADSFSPVASFLDAKVAFAVAPPTLKASPTKALCIPVFTFRYSGYVQA